MIPFRWMVYSNCRSGQSDTIRKVKPGQNLSQEKSFEGVVKIPEEIIHQRALMPRRPLHRNRGTTLPLFPCSDKI